MREDSYFSLVKTRSKLMEELKKLRSLQLNMSTKKNQQVDKVETSGKRFKVSFLVGLMAALVVAICGGVAWVVNSQ